MKIKKFVTVLLVLLLCSSYVWSFEIINLKSKRISYHKITINWDVENNAEQIAEYIVYRDNQEIATVNETSYVDLNLIPGKLYAYKVIARSVGGTSTYSSAEFSVRTLKSSNIESNAVVENVVDALHETSFNNISAISLISAIKAGFEVVLGTNVAFTGVDQSILEDVIAEELTFITDVAYSSINNKDEVTQKELESTISSFNTTSFDHVYINGLLTKIGDKHYLNGNLSMAKRFYEMSLKYLSEHEATVSNSLFRLGYFELQEIKENSTNEEIAKQISLAKEQYLRIFDLIPNSQNDMLLSSMLKNATYSHFRYFPKLLDYSDYNTVFYESAQDLISKLKSLDQDDTTYAMLYKKIEAWELLNVPIKITDEKGNPRFGILKISNISMENGKTWLFPLDSYVDERLFAIENGIVNAPLYAGHDYKLNLEVNVENGEKIYYDIPLLKFSKDQSYEYNYLENTCNNLLQAGNSVKFQIESGFYPYNLRISRGIDVFDLNWDYSQNFSYFKVFCGTKEINKVFEKTARIPLNNEDNQYNYFIIAYDENGVASKASPNITVYPEDQTKYSDFFVWMEQYFGSQPIYSYNDPDNDGVDNYNEFLNGTDPTKAPAPTPYMYNRGFENITINWNKFDNVNNLKYQILRNGQIVGTTTETKFSDVNLISGINYSYKIRVIEPVCYASDWSLPVSITTQKSFSFENAEMVQKIVDKFVTINPLEFNGISLIAAVKSSMEALTGSNIVFTVIDTNLLEEIVEQELKIIHEITPPISETERKAQMEELENDMQNSWNGNSFEEMYINSSLNKLAEDHWQKYILDTTKKTNKQAAIELAEASLFFMTNHESTVKNTLYRLGMFSIQDLTETSSVDDVKKGIEQCKNYMLRIFDYFPNIDTSARASIYKSIAYVYTKKFHRLLKYNAYDKHIYDTALQLANLAESSHSEPISIRLVDKIGKWQLVNLNIGVENNGKLIIKNISDESVFFMDPEEADERVFDITSSSTEIPVYSGHLYDVSYSTPVAGGKDWVVNFHAVKFPAGEKVTLDPFSGACAEKLSNGEDSSLVLPQNAVIFPYNLSVEKFPDMFNLKWEYVENNENVITGYKLYRGADVVMTISDKKANNIPRAVFDNGVYTYQVSALFENGEESPKSPPVKVLPDFSKDEEKYFEWKEKYFGNVATLANDDYDNDGLTNYQEFMLGSNPTIAPDKNPLANIKNVVAGAHITYYTGNVNNYSFDLLEKYKTGTISSIYIPSTSGSILQSGLSDNVAMKMKGYFDIKQPGNYRFYISANDYARLFIDNALIYEGGTANWLEGYYDIYLSTGTHYFYLEYFEKLDNSELTLSWAGENFARKTFGDNLWHTSDDATNLNEVIAWQKDSDFDGIPDYKEAELGTNPYSVDTDSDGINDFEEINSFGTNTKLADTDSDGVSDFEEIKVAFSNPLVADFSNDEVLKQSIRGSEFSTSSSNWYKEGSAAICYERNGWIEYNLNIPEKHVYVIKMFAENNKESDPNKLFNVSLTLNGIVCNSVPLKTIQDVNNSTRFYLPMLSPGNYTIRLNWVNVDEASQLKINKLELIDFKGPDLNSNNIADWIDYRLKLVGQINLPTASRISPMCIEGNSNTSIDNIEISTVAVNKKPYQDYNGNVLWYEENSQQITISALNPVIPIVKEGLRNKFYSNVEIAPNATTTITINRNGKEDTQNVTWTTTNVMNTAEITIRKGDSLLLTTVSANGENGNGVITINDERLEITNTSAIPYKFKDVGIYNVMGEFTVDNNVTTKEMVVKVIDAPLAGVPYVLKDTERVWKNSLLDKAVTIEADDNISIFRSDYSSSSNISLCGYSTGRGTIIARNGQDGPIINSTQVNVVDTITHKSDGYYKVIDVFNDGSKLIEGKIVLSEVPEDLVIKLNMYTSGTLFLDGTLKMTLTAADFDENGICRYQMIKAVDSPTSTCHGLTFYQGDNFVLSYRNW